MPKETEVQAEIDRMYEDESATDELNDEEATLLLEWGEASLNRLVFTDSINAEEYGTNLRQLIKRVNRFVGKRTYEDEETQARALTEMLEWIAKNGFSVDEAQVKAVIPDDVTDMMGTLEGILSLLAPPTPLLSQPQPLPPASPLPLPPLPLSSKGKEEDPLSKLVNTLDDWLKPKQDTQNDSPTDKQEEE